MTSDLGMIEFAEDEGREVLDLLVGGEGVGQHGGVCDPLVWPGHRVGLPASSSQQGSSCLLVTVLKVLQLPHGLIAHHVHVHHLVHYEGVCLPDQPGGAKLLPYRVPLPQLVGVAHLEQE